MRRRDFLRGALATGVVGAAAGQTSNAHAASAGTALQSDAAIIPVRLRCESFRNPLGLDVAQPRMAWQLQPVDQDARGLRQLAYQVRVASAPELLVGRPDLWDSGFVETSEQLQVEYAGADLASRARCFWQVRVWDAEGESSAWSRPSHWEMGLLEPSDWEGSWIGDGSKEPGSTEGHYEEDPAPLLRREFELGGPVAHARLYAAGLGYYELRLNGEKISDHVLDPAWTSFDKRVPYTSHDVTAMLQSGDNVMGAMLGNGWYNPLPMQMWGRINIREHMITGRPRLIAQLEVTYEDGSRQTVGTDEEWTHHPGPIRRNSVYLGEEYDARDAQPGWDASGFDASAWSAAVAVADASDALGPLRAQDVPPIRITDRIEPVSVNEISSGIFIFDMGQNFAGWARLRVEGPPGVRVRMRFGELLYADGRLNPMTAVAGQIKRRSADGISVGGPGAPEVAEQLDTYTLSGNGIEIYTPRFTFHGFRYVEVSGFPGRPGTDALEGLRLNTDVESVGEFSCADETLNEIQSMVQWTLLSNLFSVQSDCPAREKFQYGGDIVATSEMATLNYDFSNFYAKATRDHGEAAREGGWLTETAPFVGISAENYAPDAAPIGWGLAHPLLAVQLHRYYGDRRIVEEQYDTAKRWVDNYAEHADGHIIDRCISDHESLDPRPDGHRPLPPGCAVDREDGGDSRSRRRPDSIHRARDGDRRGVRRSLLGSGNRRIRSRHPGVPGHRAHHGTRTRRRTPGSRRPHGRTGSGRAWWPHRGRHLRNEVSPRGTDTRRPRRRRLRDGADPRVPWMGLHARPGRHHPVGALGVQRQHLLAQPPDVRLGERVILQGHRRPST